MAGGVVRETSAATTGLLVRYVRKRGGEEAVAAVLEHAGIHDTPEELTDPSRWFSYDDHLRLLAAVVEVFADENAPFEIGASAVRSGVDASVMLAVRAFGSPRQLYRQLPRAVGKFTTTSTMRIVDAGRAHVTVDFQLKDGYAHSRLDCRYAQGLLAAVPTAFDLPPAEVVQLGCASDGAPVCTYRVTWQRRRRPFLGRHGTDSVERAALRSQLEALQSAAADLAGSDDPTTALERIVARAGTAVVAPSYLCVVASPDGDEPLVHSAGLTDECAAEMAGRLDRGEDLGSHAIVVEVATARRHHGWLVALYPEGQRGPDGERSLLQAYAGHAASALDQLWALEAVRRDESRARALLRLTHQLSSARDDDEVCQVVASALLRIVGSERASTMRWNPAAGELRATATAGNMTAQQRVTLLGTGLRPDDTPELVDMLARREPVVVAASTASPVLCALLAAVGVERLVAVPLVAGDTLLGVATAGWTTATGDVTPDLVERMQGVAEQAAIALQNARLLAEVRHQSLHDTLTGLPNRLLFNLQLDRALRSLRQRGAVAVLFGDLDGFKAVNDEFGHAAGDELLRQVAARLRGVVRPGDLVARLSGDEFAIVVSVTDPGTARALADRVIEVFEGPFRVEGRELLVTASLGVAIHEGPEGDGDRLLRAADAAMYQAKQRGRNQVVVAGSPGQVAIGSLGDELAAAIDGDQLRVDFQPIIAVADVDLGPPEVVGVEALVRWQHPRLGRLSPVAFQTLAEQRGLAVDLDLAVLRSACETLAAHRDDTGRSPYLAVNVSVSTLLDRRLTAAVRAARRDHAIAPGQLVLEVTESRSLVDLPGVVQRLTELRHLGVRISLDDFGTGFSTLTWLHGLPIDQIKLDRSFVGDLPSDESAAALVRGVIALARELSLEVVAEGVETAEQLEALSAAGCRRVQGYLFGRAAAHVPTEVAIGA